MGKLRGEEDMRSQYSEPTLSHTQSYTDALRGVLIDLGIRCKTPGDQFNTWLLNPE